MAELSNKYINLVVLGSFNPSILTHKFLVDECGFNLGDEPTRRAPSNPVVASLDYDRISFLADLGRFQITENQCTDPKSSQLPSYLSAYLDKLNYTPITKCGSNFRCDLTIENSRTETIRQWLKNDRNEFCKILKLKAVDLDVCFVLDNKEEKVRTWTLKTARTEYNATTRMIVSHSGEQGSIVRIDFNYDVANLDRNKKLLESITVDYPNVVDLFNYQVEKLFTG
jgi:hypothetical protein